MAQVYGRKHSGKLAEPLLKSSLFRLLFCAFLFIAAAVCKNVLPEGYREALVMGLDSGLNYREVLSVCGEALSSREAFSRLWDAGIPQVFGPADGENEESAAPAFDTPAEADPDTSAQMTSVFDLTAVETIPVLQSPEIGIDPGELPPESTEPESEEVSPEDPKPSEKTEASEKTSPEAEPEPADESSTAPRTDENGTPLPDIVSLETVALPFTYLTPVYGVLTSDFGYRDHPIDGEYKFHYGVDLAAPTGTDVACFADGEILFAGWGEINGYYIRVKHAEGIETLYAHLDEILVRQGDTVALGDVIGRVGETGETSGPHLHFQVYSNGILVDPLQYISYM